MRRFVAILMAAASVVVAEGPEIKPLLPEFPTAQVAIPWSELKALIEERREAEVQRPRELPPVEWTIAEAVYTATAANNAAAQVEAAFDIYVWKPEGWTEIPLLSPTVAPTEILLDGNPSRLVATAGDMQGLVLNEPGPHRVEASFYAPLTAVEGVITMDFPAAPAAINRVHLEVAVPDAVIQAPDAAGKTTEKTETGVAAYLAFRRAPNIVVSWQLPAKLEKPKPVEPPRVTCTASTLAGVSERVLACDTLLVFNVARGAVDTFSFTLPARVNVLQVDGEGSAWSRAEAGDVQRIDVKVNHPIPDQYTLSVRYELPIDGELATLTVPELVAENVVRQTGWLGVVARDNVEISPAPDISGYTRVDLSELPAALLSLAANPILLAYRQNQAGGALSLDVRKLADVAVRPATIDLASYTTLLTREGSRMTRATYSVRNNVQQYLRVRLGADVKVSSASVGGRLVKPARDNNGDATVLIPLLQSAVQGKVLGAFPVEIVYTEAGGALPSGKGQLQLDLPAADLPIGRTSWEIWLPDTHTATDSKGDLDPDTPDMLGYMPDESTERARRTPKGVREVQLHRLKEGVERFFITDINNPAASVGGGQRYAGQPIQEPESGSAAVAGILPVAVELPLEGVPYAFNRVLVAEQQPLELTLSLYETAAARRLVGAQVAVALIMGIAFGVALRTRRVRGYAVATMLLIVLGLLAAYGYRYGIVQWEPVVIAAVVGSILTTTPRLMSRVAARFASRRAASQVVAEPAE